MMAAATSDVDVVDVSKLTGEFDLNCTVCYNVINLGRYVLNSFENTFNFCCELNVLKKQRTCQRCRRELRLSFDSRDDHTMPVVFRCTNKCCRKQYISVRDGSFFDDSKLSLGQILLIVNLYCGKITSYEQIQYQGQLSETKLSRSTIADWLSYCREVCLETIARETPTLIGGPNLTVEIDESKFGKRKYNKGRLIEGQWVVGGICRETKDVFLAVCPENKRDAATLMDIIERHVSKDSTIITDCWKAYDQLDADGWTHMTVNHQYNFVGTYASVNACAVINIFFAFPGGKGKRKGREGRGG